MIFVLFIEDVLTANILCNEPTYPMCARIMSIIKKEHAHIHLYILTHIHTCLNGHFLYYHSQCDGSPSDLNHFVAHERERYRDRLN
jgi:hypothetical protein